MSLFFLRGSLRKILGYAQDTFEHVRKTRSIVQVILKEIYAMSQTTEKLAAAVDAIVARLGEIATENATLKAQLATYADLEDKAAALEVAAATDAAAEQDATDRLAAAIAAVAATRAG